jgi:hypothetical protein
MPIAYAFSRSNYRRILQGSDCSTGFVRHSYDFKRCMYRYVVDIFESSGVPNQFHRDAQVNCGTNPFDYRRGGIVASHGINDDGLHGDPLC